MADRLRQVAARALHDPEVGDLHHRRLAEVEAVGEDQAARVGLADAGHERPHDLVVALDEVALVRLHPGRLVDEVEAQLAARDPLVARGERLPVEDGGGEGLVPLGLAAREEVHRLHLPAVDAVAGEAVEVDVDVDAVLPAQLDGAVDLLQRLLAHERPVVAAAPAPVVEGQAREVEAPLRHRREVGLLEGGAVVRVAGPAEAALEVEAAPAGNPARGGLVVRGQRRARGDAGGDAEDGQVLDELPSSSSALPPQRRASSAGPQTTPRAAGGKPVGGPRHAGLYSRHSPERRCPCLDLPSPWPSPAATLASAALAGPQASSPPPTAQARRKVADELDAYLWKHVLKPRFPRCVDKEHGGFHVNYARDWSPLRGPLPVHRLRGPGRVDGGDRRPAAPRDARGVPALRPPRRALPRRRDVGPRARGLPHVRGPLRPRRRRGVLPQPPGVRAGLRDLRPGRRPRRDAATPSRSSSRSAPTAGSRTTTGTTSGPGTAAR